MKELIVLSGKGGTGKTSLTASFAKLAERPVIADCDVDAADLHLVLAPTLRERHEFFSGHEAQIMPEVCCNCGVCLPECRFDAIMEPAPEAGHDTYWIDATACEGCGVCLEACPMDSIDFPERRCGEWMISDTACGPLVHARLGIAAENSGKLVTTVRQQARRLAEAGNHPLIIVDGPPGIGCPVIASVTGASHVLVVTEPSVSGEHDMERVLGLTAHFGIPTSICVNKWDINPSMCERIEAKARKAGAQIAGRIRYDTSVTQAQIQERAVIDSDAPCAEDIRAVWTALGLQ
ncbi:ATP-binding protein [Propionivibrio limicola]|uniref:ATP-binding protein n=1 Tax=Propionivibrio limicola TaxID=167645 RepID=UPI0012921418|nr:ATP-binding protein [Propionivibrio limicola]